MAHSDIAVFLDRDGTVNVDVDFLTTPDQLLFIPRSVSAIRELNELDLKVFIITNQSGIARGLLSEEQLHVIHAAMKTELERRGAAVDDFFYCPHFPGVADRRYNIDCECRKPKPGMLLQAETRYGIDLRRSFVIGDRCRDMECGKAVGAATAIVSTGYGMGEIPNCRATTDFVAKDLYEAVQFVKSVLRSRTQPAG